MRLFGFDVAHPERAVTDQPGAERSGSPACVASATCPCSRREDHPLRDEEQNCRQDTRPSTAKSSTAQAELHQVERHNKRHPRGEDRLSQLDRRKAALSLVDASHQFTHGGGIRGQV